MDTSRESNPQPRTEQVESDDQSSAHNEAGGSDVEAQKVQFEHYGVDDPYRAARLAALNEQTGAFLSEVGFQHAGFNDFTPDELQALQRDAEERAAWSKPHADAFRSILRMGQRTPPRSRRIL